MAEKVLVGMSGGVDSSAAALLLKRAGYDVTGATLLLQDEKACAEEAEREPLRRLRRHLPFQGRQWDAVSDAKKVCGALGIEHLVIDFRNEFSKRVVDYFTREYLRGRTPNPCVACNRYIKWEALLEKANRVGADAVATGHYAKLLKLPDGRYTVGVGTDKKKDQSYALCRLTQEQLSKTLLPLGEYTKSEVRQLAREASLPVADRPESQEVCFIPDDDHASFIEKETGVKAPEGNFVAEDGRVLGRHKGITHYTIGQRRGLQLPMGRRVFVKEIRPETNEVVISDTGDVFSRALMADNLNFVGIPGIEAGCPWRFIGKIRYGHAGAECVVKRTAEDEIECIFDAPVRAVTPGQAFVFYKDGYIAGSGIII